MTCHVVVAGLGSIGQRHLANVRALEPGADITVWRHGPDVRGRIPAGANQLVYGQAPLFEPSPNYAIVAGPANTHVASASRLAELGAHILVEKPIASTLEGVDGLIGLCRARGVSMIVGYNFRFYRPLQILRDAVIAGRIGRVLSARAEVGQYLPDWRPDRDYREGVTARAELGGGALLELSHEIDYVRWIVGEVTAVGARIATLGDLDVDVEDTAELLLEFEGGAIGSVHLDLLQRTPARSCKIVGTTGTITWDGSSHAVRLFEASTREWVELHGPGTIDRNEMYLEELRSFLSGARGATTAGATGEDARRVLEIVLAAREASMTRRMVNL